MSEATVIIDLKGSREFREMVAEMKKRGGRFDGATKTWRVPAERLDDWAEHWHSLGWYKIVGGDVDAVYWYETPAAEETAPAKETESYRHAPRRSGVTQPCRRCGTYCYGDCSL